MTERSNEEWLSALRPPPDATATGDLRSVLIRGLRGALSSRDNVGDADYEDFAQDAVVKILDSLESFRGESRFTTWAHKVTVRVALTELRRKRWRDWSLDKIVEGDASADGGDYTPAFMADATDGPEAQTVQASLMDVVRRTMDEKLTERQRTVLNALVVEGVPMDVVADQLGSNRNAIYKLVFDARQRLKAELLATGLTVDEILEAFG